MTAVIHINSLEIQSAEEKGSFLKDVDNGLSQPHKNLPSKYFYDERGSELFNKITQHPDYYLTNCELDILNTYKHDLADIFGKESFNLIELGPGEGIKTQILLDAFVQNKLQFKYAPVDISAKYLHNIIQKFTKILSGNISPLQGDYFDSLQWLCKNSSQRNVVLFLGSSIGNFNYETTIAFFKKLWENLNHNDYVLIGFDLIKDINLLNKAYDDSDGITREFNLNLLTRMNRELQANFNLHQFQHYAAYNDKINAMESYLISKTPQAIRVPALAKTFSFKCLETFHLEYSHKYTLPQIADFAEASGFTLMNNFFDSKNYFVDTLWQVKKY